MHAPLSVSLSLCLCKRDLGSFAAAYWSCLCLNAKFSSSTSGIMRLYLAHGWLTLVLSSCPMDLCLRSIQRLRRSRLMPDKASRSARWMCATYWHPHHLQSQSPGHLVDPEITFNMILLQLTWQDLVIILIIQWAPMMPDVSTVKISLRMSFTLTRFDAFFTFFFWHCVTF